MSGFRVGIRLFYHRNSSGPSFRVAARDLKKLLVIGAGDAGEKLLREVKENGNLHYHVAGFVDDDPYKVRRSIHGVPILGMLKDMNEIARGHDIDEIVIAIPSAAPGQMREFVKRCESTNLPFKTLPGLGELLDGRVSVNSIREVRYEDLLGRQPVELDLEEIGEYLSGKRIMVTGGAGSIGSELCRQIARFGPEKLIIADSAGSDHAK